MYAPIDANVNGSFTLSNLDGVGKDDKTPGDLQQADWAITDDKRQIGVCKLAIFLE